MLIRIFLIITFIFFGSIYAVSATDKIDSELIPPDIILSNPSRESSALPNPSTSLNSPSLQSPISAPKLYGSGNLQTATTSCGPQPSPSDMQKPDPIAIIDTAKGKIIVRLFRKFAPKTVTSFIDIANHGFYNGTVFHRVQPGFCIQGGDPYGNGSGVYFEPGSKQIRLLPLEVSSVLKHNAPGVVSMAHFPKNPNTASCQFYITLAPQPQLDGQYSIFGGVIEGMNVVNSISKGDRINSLTVVERTEPSAESPKK